MSTFSFNLFDPRRTGVEFPLLIPSEMCPIYWDEALPAPRWINQVSEETIPKLRAAREHFCKIATNPAADCDDDCGFAEFLKYYTLVSQFEMSVHDPPPSDVGMPVDVSRQQIREWAVVEQATAMYNVAMARCRQATAKRFSVGYDGPDVVEADMINLKNSLDPKLKDCQPPKKIGQLYHVQRLFEEAAGLFEYVAALADESSSDETFAELDGKFCQMLKLMSLGCAHETLLQYHVVENRDGRFCGLVASGIAHHFSQAHATLTTVDLPGLIAKYKEGLLSVLFIKQAYYNGVGHFYFNPNSPSRRQKALEHLEACLKQVVKNQVAFRKLAENEVKATILEVKTYKQNKHTSTRFKDQALAEADPDSVLPQSKAKPMPRMPKVMKQIRMYLFWKAWSVRSAEGLEKDDPPPAEKEWWEEEEPPTEVPKGSPAEKEAARKAAMALPQGERDWDRAVKMECVVAHRDLYTGDLKEEDDVFAHSLPFMVRLTTQLKPTRETVNLCLVLIVDCTGYINVSGADPEQPGIVQGMLKELLQCTGLTKRDYVGIMTFHAGMAPRMNMFQMDPEGQKAICGVLEKTLRGTGSTSITEAVSSSLEWMNGPDGQSIQASSYEMLIFTDGNDCNDLAGNWRNWGTFHSMIAAVDDNRTNPNKKQIRVHGFAIGPVSDKYLVEAIALKGGGDFSKTEASKEGVSNIRTWFLKHFADQFSKVASNISLTIKCLPGVTVTQVGTDPFGCVPTDATREHYPVPGDDPDNARLSLTPKENFLHDWQIWENPGNTVLRTFSVSAKIYLEDLSDGNVTHIPFAIRVAKPNIRKLVTPLCDVEVSYQDAVQLQQKTIQRRVMVNGIPSLLTRSLHSWLPSMYVVKAWGEVTVTPGVIISPQEKKPIPVLGGHWVDQKDRITLGTKNSMIDLLLTEHTSVEISGESRVDVLTVAHNPIFVPKTPDEEPPPPPHLTQLQMSRGTARISTPAKSSLVLICDSYTIKFGPRTKCKVQYENGVLTANCIMGQAFVTTNNVANLIPALRETRAAGGAPPGSSWLMPDTEFQEWVKDPTLKATVEVEGQINRVVTGQSLLKAAGMLRKNIHNEPSANLRCREFLIKQYIKYCATRLSNSCAWGADNVRVIKNIQNEAIANAIKSPPPKGPVVPLKLEDEALSLLRERPRGMSDLFVAQYQVDFLTAFADARKKEEMARKAAEEAAAGESRNGEVTRRMEAVAGLFELWDMDGSGYIEFQELNQVFLIFALEGSGQWAAILERWEDLLEDDVITLQLDLSQLQVMMVHLAEPYQKDEYDSLIRAVQAILESLVELNEKTRMSRAIWNLFQLWDKMRVGFIDAEEILAVIGSVTQSPGSDAALFKGSEAFEAMVKELRKPLSALCTDNIDQADAEPVQQVGLQRFHQTLNLLLAGCSEMEFHSALFMIKYHLEQKTITHGSLAFAFTHETRSEGFERTVGHDLRHCFDGLGRKDLQKYLAKAAATPPPDVLSASKVICELAGIEAPVIGETATGGRFRAEAKAVVQKDYYGTLRQMLEGNMVQLFEFLKIFPVLSVSYKQLKALWPELNHVSFDPALMMGFSPIFARLVEWVKLVVKAVLLDHDWDFTTPEEVRKQQYDQHARQPLFLEKENIRALTEPKKKLRKDGTVDESAVDTASPEHRLNLLARLGAGRLAVGKRITQKPPPTVSLDEFGRPDVARRRRGQFDPLDELPEGDEPPLVQRLIGPPPSSRSESAFSPEKRGGPRAALWPPSNTVVSPPKIARGSGFAAASPRRLQ